MRFFKIAMSIADLKHRNEVMDVLLDSEAASGPFDGGCLIFAKALQFALDTGIIVRMESDVDGGKQAEHYGLALADGTILDADGPASGPEEWVGRFIRNEMLDRPVVVVPGIMTDSDIPDDPHAAKELAKIIRRLLGRRTAASLKRLVKTAQKWQGTAYHGGADVGRLDSGAAPGSSTGNPTAGWGTFFTPDEKEARRYVDDFHDGEGRLHRVRVELENPYMMSFPEYETFVKLDLSKPTDPQMEENRRRADRFKQKIVERGFDGIVIGRPGVPRPMEIVVFNSKSIKKIPTEAVKNVVSASNDALTEKARLFRQWGAEVNNGKVVLYRGGNVPAKILRDLRYGDYLSAVKSGTDATGNEGAAGYGKTVVRFELPLEWVELASTGEFQYKGPAKSLKGGDKWPPEIYRAYNDYWSSNFTAEEIDSQDDVAQVAPMSLSGGRDEFKRLVQKWRDGR